jgi:hypothetical protein
MNFGSRNAGAYEKVAMVTELQQMPGGCSCSGLDFFDPTALSSGIRYQK